MRSSGRHPSQRDETRVCKRFVRGLVQLLVLGTAAGCGDDSSTSVDLVTVRGIVRAIDTGVPAPNTKVTLLGTSYSSPETGTDGAYVIRIPRGSKLELYTDDFSPSMADESFPLINVDVPAIVASANIDDWSIHTCPQTAAPGAGSVAIWDQYLALADDQNYGDRYVSTTSAATSGVVSILAWGCEGGAQANPTGLEFDFESPAFPVGYGKWKFMANNLDPAVGTDLLYPVDRAVCDTSGWVLSWGDPAFTGTTVRTTVRDTSSARGLAFVSPFDIPVRPGTISLVWYCYVDGQANKTFKEMAQCIGLLPQGRIASKAALARDIRR